MAFSSWLTTRARAVSLGVLVIFFFHSLGGDDRLGHERNLKMKKSAAAGPRL
jgi:hypothetical protein